MSRILYVSYDGMTDQLGQSQVIPYLLGLTRLGHRFTLISFEKPARFRTGGREVQRQLDEHGIRWVPMRYSKHPQILSTIWDLLKLRQCAFALHRATPFDIVHCRSYLPCLVGLALKRQFGTRFVFDMRGFWADERVDGGLWNLRNPLFRLIYRYFKRYEREFLGMADGIISLTEAGRRAMQAWPGYSQVRSAVTVIPCSVDFTEFKVATPERRAKARHALGLPQDSWVAMYVGSIGTWYMLDEMLDFFAVQKENLPSSRFVVLTRDGAEPIYAGFRTRGLDLRDLVVRSATRPEVQQFLTAADFGLFFIRPSYSKLSCSPAKLGEYLATGVPVVTNSGVGDVADVLEATGGGLLVEDFSPGSYQRALGQARAFRTIDPKQIRERARARVCLETAVRRYHEVYEQTLNGASPQSRLSTVVPT